MTTTLNDTAKTKPLELKGMSTLASTNVIRMGIVGAPGTGKTVSAATFPNPVFLNFDNSLFHLKSLPFIDVSNIREIPFHDLTFPYRVMGIPAYKGQVPDYKTALPRWLQTEGVKLQSEHTLVIDSWTRVQDYFSFTQEVDPENGNNHFHFWGEMLDWSTKLMSFLTSLKCNVVVIFHESAERDKKTGELLSKMQPVQQGKFITKIGGYFPYFFRQTVKVDDKGERTFLWQTKADKAFDPKNANNALAQYVKAEYKSLI